MAYRSDREPGHPAERPRHHSLQSRVGPSSRIPSGPAVRKRLHQQAGHKTAPDQRARSSNRHLQRGSHPHRTLVQVNLLSCEAQSGHCWPQSPPESGRAAHHQFCRKCGRPAFSRIRDYDDVSSSDATCLSDAVTILARCNAVTRLTCAMLHPANSAVLAMLMPASRRPTMRRWCARSGLRPVYRPARLAISIPSR